ncbi:hypothetical protein BuS5_03532 [Desulfosarcina sp. BuS5]|nr:hypothetical protein BuS5_03532 [Desulfosarcina sp. BuS5]
MTLFFPMLQNQECHYLFGVDWKLFRDHFFEFSLLLINLAKRLITVKLIISVPAVKGLKKMGSYAGVLEPGMI